MRPRREVHISDWSSGEHQTGDKLGEVVRCDSVTVTGVEDGTLQNSVLEQ